MMTTPSPADLIARTEPIDDRHVDLLAIAGDDGLLFEQDGVGLAGRGVATRVPADDVDAALRAIATDDRVGRPGTGPVAIGALPFDPDADGTLTIPRLIVGRAADGTAWQTTIGRRDGAEPIPEPTRAGHRPPDGFTLTSPRSHDEWCTTIAEAVDRIRAGRLGKVVLAREVIVETNRPIVTADVLGRLRALYPSCMVFSVDGFVGASPELLLGREGAGVSSHPLAGTIPRSGDPVADDRLARALLSSDKDRAEHRFVVDQVAAVLAPWCRSLDVPENPSIVPLRNVSHLGTRVTGQLAAGAPSALELARLLHPTPAVAGTPTADALEWIRKAEGFDRDRYAGPVGWVDRHGDGRWAVGIRSAEVDGGRARLFAGVGVVADSDPDDELAETQLKLQALLAAIVRP